MKNLALIISANQNEVSKNEIEKIRKEVKKENPDYRIKVIANERLDDAEIEANKCDDTIIFHTSDVNNDVWAEFVEFASTVSFEGRNGNQTIALN